MILADNETKADLLNNEAIARTIVSLLKKHSNDPVTIGVHGDWGAGKSSILEMIEHHCEQDKGVLCLKFNGWRFQGFEDAKIALLEGIVEGLIEKRPAITKATDYVKALYRRIDWLKLAKKGGSAAITAYTGIPNPEQLSAAAKLIGSVIDDPAKLATPELVKGVAASLGDFIKPADVSKNVPEEIKEFRKEFDKLLNNADIKQLIVLVDDLDRCLPETAIETLEAIRLFVFTSKTAFVVAADEAMIEYSVRKHFPDLPESTGPRDYARNYLEKLIQVPFRIPALGEVETRIYVTLLLASIELNDKQDTFNKLVAAAREKLKKPWANELINTETVKDFGVDKTKLEQVITLSDQIGPKLAAGTRGNPRQIKRFLNTLVLRQMTAEARGFGAEIKRPALAKLMLAERFIPRLFEQIADVAASDPKGACPDLVSLDKAARKKEEKATDAQNPEDGKVEPNESLILKEWLNSPEILQWARLDPALSTLDLRPYFFAAKDKKDFFSTSSAVGPLAAMINKLMGPKLGVQAHESDLKKILPAEASAVFEGVRQRILSKDTFDTEPEGIAGLQVLVRSCPHLQPSLLGFLDSLPVEKLGGWVVAGWATVLTEQASKTQFEVILKKWQDTGSGLLKAAAQTTLKTIKAR